MTVDSQDENKPPLSSLWPNVLLVFGGGNALGAFHGGAYAALHEAGIRPACVAGASIGAITAALIAGNSEADRVAKLRAFWDLAAHPLPPGILAMSPKGTRLASAIQARLLGRPGLFEPVIPRLLDALPLGAPALYQTRSLGRTLTELLDFQRLADGPCRFVVTATDLDTGECVAFRSDRERITPEHLRASTALPGDFEPIVIGGRTLGDGGLTSNLPVAAGLGLAREQDTLCIAIDLIDPRARRLTTLDDLNQRRSDLMFAAQARSEIQLVRAQYELEQARGQERGALLVAHVIRRADQDEPSQKEFDYSESSIGARWDAGQLQMRAMLDSIAAAGRPTGFVLLEPGY